MYEHAHRVYLDGSFTAEEEPDDYGRLGAAPGRTPGRRSLTDQLAKASASEGRPLPAVLGGRLEQALGTLLVGVRLHVGAASAEAATALGANAWTLGQDIHFAEGRYDPDSRAGQRLIAHEVAHTVQQGGAAPALDRVEVSAPGDAHEREAEAFAQAFVA